MTSLEPSEENNDHFQRLRSSLPRPRKALTQRTSTPVPATRDGEAQPLSPIRAPGFTAASAAPTIPAWLPK